MQETSYLGEIILALGWYWPIYKLKSRRILSSCDAHHYKERVSVPLVLYQLLDIHILDTNKIWIPKFYLVVPQKLSGMILVMHQVSSTSCLNGVSDLITCHPCGA